MFANLFFVILNLLLITSVLDQRSSLLLSNNPGLAFIYLAVTYPIFLLFLSNQCSRLSKRHFRNDHIILLANIEVLLFFCFYYFILGAGRWLIANSFPISTVTLSIFSLLLFFTALFTCYYSIEKSRIRKSALNNAWMSIRFLFPFVIPFLLVSLFTEANNFVPIDRILNSFGVSEEALVGTIFISLMNLAAVLTTLIILPPMAVLIWGCPKLKESELKNELDQLCAKAKFKHAGFRIWTIMNNSMTAAILGLIGKLRYVLFTQKLIDHVPRPSIVAILAHEIGHSHYHHLFYYPVILFGMVVTASLAHFYLFGPLMTTIAADGDFAALIPFLSFLLFGSIVALYFRIVFGYFSRIFERQADLHIFNLGCPAADMVEALDMLAVAAGNIHREPNWHHYSIQQRIDCINEADRDRSLISKHAKHVRISLLVYFLILVFGVWKLL